MTTLARLLALIALLVHVQSIKLSFPGITLRKNSAQELESREKFAPAIIASSAKKQLITLNALELCLCGAFSTMLGDFVMHPIDTIKIVQQTSLRPIGFFSAATTIFKSKGIIGFFPGVIPYLACDGLSGAIKFASFELSRAFVESKIPQKFHPLSQFICAAGAMLCCSVALVPGEVLKIRLQSGAVKSLGEGVVNIYKKDGLRGFFAGYGATLVRDVPFTMLELGVYENLKALIRYLDKRSALSPQQELAAAAFTGASVGFVTTPLDLIKTKLTMQSTSGGQYAGVVDAFRSIYSAGGVSALFVGSVARVAWLLPFTTIYLGIYELSKKTIIAAKTKALAQQQ